MPTYDETGALRVSFTGGGILADHQHSAPGDGGTLTLGTTIVGGATQGRVLFAGVGLVIDDDAALYWDNVNKRLGVGVAAPASTLTVGANPASPAALGVVGIVTQAAIEAQQTGTGNIINLRNATTAVVVVKNSGFVGIYDTTPARRLQVADDSASTGVIIPIARLESEVSGGAGAAGHGPSLELYGESTTTEDQSMAEIAARWSVATHASRRARIELYAAYIGTDVLCGVIEAPAFASANGNARGVGAVDLQGYRTAVTQVANGTYAVIGGGSGNTASANASTVPGGFDNVASGTGSFAHGSSGTASHTGSWVWSSAAATVSWGNNTFTARCHGGARFYSAAGVGTGVQLTAGGNAWAAISVRATKANFRPVEDVLAKVALLPVYDYNLKSQADTVRHVGPVAEDFNGIFGFTEAEGYINTMDVSGVALAAIKALLERVEKIEEVLQ